MKERILLATGLLVSGASAYAHEGHGAVTGALHYIAEPAHLLPTLAVVAVVAFIARRKLRQG